MWSSWVLFEETFLEKLHFWYVLVLKRGPEFCDYSSPVNSNTSLAGSLWRYM